MRALSFLRSVWRNRRRRDDLPRFLTHTVTFGCNARCRMCDSWKLPTAGDLTLDEIEAIYRQLPRMDGVRLTGGEPTVRKDLDRILALAVDVLDPLFVHVTTNGFMTDRVVRLAEERDRRVPLDLLVSIDGYGEKHDEVRGVKQSWRRAMETVRALAPRRRELNLRLAINQTIVDAEGVEHYRRLRDELAALDVKNQVVLAYDASATYSTERDLEIEQAADSFQTFGRFERHDLEQLIADLEEDSASYDFVTRQAKRYYLDGLRERLLGDGSGPNPPCVALNAHLRLFPNGDVPTCQFNSKIVGNLREQPFEAVWASTRAREQRDWVRKCPGCWAECEVLPSAIYTGDLLTRSVGRALRGQAARL